MSTAYQVLDLASLACEFAFVGLFALHLVRKFLSAPSARAQVSQPKPQIQAQPAAPAEPAIQPKPSKIQALKEKYGTTLVARPAIAPSITTDDVEAVLRSQMKPVVEAVLVGKPRRRRRAVAA